MFGDTDKTGRNAAQRARVQAARAAIVHKMEVDGWQPTKLRGYSKRYRVTMQKGHSATVAIKVQTVHRGVMKPLRGVAGVAAGVSAALQYLMSRRPNPQNATLDEEMFI